MMVSYRIISDSPQLSSSLPQMNIICGVSPVMRRCTSYGQYCPVKIAMPVRLGPSR
jgi:hypothetical protein